DVLRHPHIAITRVPRPLAVRREVVIESINVDRVLSGRGAGKAKPVRARQRQARRREERGEHQPGQQRFQPMSRVHSILQVPGSAPWDAKLSSLTKLVCAFCGQTLAGWYENRHEWRLTNPARRPLSRRENLSLCSYACLCVPIPGCAAP